ncbi:MAG: polymorphic toxin-type HINT domain-containing protein, partial [Planctomycetaceae bacterium]
RPPPRSPPATARTPPTAGSPRALPELGAVGPAEVLAIEPCPPLASGPGRTVTGTFAHAAANVLDLEIEGLDTPLGCTANHPFWSADRQDFVPAGSLTIGEHLRTESGTLRQVTRITPRRGPPVAVFNLEVDAEHVYFVSTAGVLVHNAYPRNAPNRGANWFDDVAKAATRNAESDTLVLGHFAREGSSYQKVAAHYRATYFKVDDWKTVTKGLSQDEIWRINETFLDQQIRQGKKILFSHDPLKARPNSFFEREVEYLRELGYQFRQKNQWTWEAVR